MLFRQAVGFLQNAWSPFWAGGTWPRRYWLKALMLSRSGQRLKTLIDACPALEYHWDNTTPIVGDTPDSVIPASYDHIVRVLRAQMPDVVITFGVQAAEALSFLSETPRLILPHPAYRIVTNKLFRRAGELLCEGFRGTVELRQGRGQVNVRRL
jgi:hypothetical protein